MRNNHIAHLHLIKIYSNSFSGLKSAINISNNLLQPWRTHFMKNLFLAVLLIAITISSASANPITADLPSDTYITIDGLDWTWASPVNEQSWGSGYTLMDPSFHAGWRFATDIEMANHPSLADFTSLSGSIIQSVAYWNTIFTHVDATDFSSGLVASSWGHGFYETLYVRNVNSTNPVPEPSTMILLGAGLAGLFCYGRKQKK